MTGRRREAGVEAVIGRYAGQTLDGTERVVSQDAAEIFDVVAGEGEGGRVLLAGGFEGTGSAEVVGAEDDLKGLCLACGEVELALQGVIANCFNGKGIVAFGEVG